MKENKLTDLEKALQEKLENVDFQYQESDWLALEKALPKSGSAPLSSFSAKLAAGLLLVAGSYGLYTVFSSETKSASTELSSPAKTKPAIETNVDTKQIENKQTTEEITIESKATDSEFSPEDVTLKETEPTEVNEPEIAILDSLESKPDLGIKQKEANLESITILKIEERGTHCIGEEIELRAVLSKASEEAVIQWTVNEEILESSKQTQILQIEHAGKYEISARLIDSESNLAFEVLALPEIDFTYQDNSDAYFDQTAILKAEPAELDFRWDIEGLDNNVQGSKVEVDFGEFGLHDVELSFQNELGCVATKLKPVSIQKDFDELAPSHFTPNGDGMNEEFIPMGFKEVPGDFKFYVFNENGRQVFFSQSREIAWNGKENNSGRELSEGIYVWKVVISNKEREKAFTGKVRLKISSF